MFAFVWDVVGQFVDNSDGGFGNIDETPNLHNQLLYFFKKVPKPLADRDGLMRLVWKETGENCFLVVASPAESARRPPTASALRMQLFYAMKIARKNDRETTIDYVIHPNVGGVVQGVMKKVIFARFLRRSLGHTTDIQQYFQEQRGLEDWDADDGRAVGEVMCVATREERRRENRESKVGARMRELIKKQKGLGEIAEKYEFFPSLITRVVENKLRLAGAVDAPLCDVSKKEGRAMGRGLAMAMATNLTAEAGVDEWVLKYKCLGEVDRTEAWFRPMLNVVAERLLGEVSWGLKMRVIMGAGLSILDMGTDAFVIVGYMGRGETKGYAGILLTMVLASLALQLLTVFVQNKKKPWMMATEMLVVLTGLKRRLIRSGSARD